MAYSNKYKTYGLPIVGFAAFSLLLVVILWNVSNGLGFGGLYSPSQVHFNQTNALLSGKLALSNDVRDLKFDMVWHNDKVQQVWGLGVPMLRLPFYALGHLFGFAGFPDIIIFFFYIFLALFSLGFASYLWLKKKEVREAWAYAGLIMTVAALFPPVIMMMRTVFAVHKEVIVYGYFYVIFLFSLLITLNNDTPSKKGFLGLCFLAGCAGFIRPTLFAYALPIVILAFIQTKKHVPRLFHSVGICAVATGVILLLITNYVRFGNPTEFGHHVNVAPDAVSVNITRFDSEYIPSVPLYKKFAETFGGLFLVSRPPASRDPYLPDVFPLQNEEIRWRDISFPSLHWYHLAAFLLLGVYGFRKKNRFGWIPMVGFALLFGFYSTLTILGSRYSVDFAATFSIALVITLLCTAEMRTRRDAILAICVISAMYATSFFSDMRNLYPLSASLTSQPEDGLALSQTLPEKYILGNTPGISPFNGLGWNSTTGGLKVSATFFVRHPQFIQLSLECVKNECANLEKDLHAELDGKYLEKPTIARTGKNIEAVFQVSQTLEESDFMQVLFIQCATVGKSIPSVDFILKELTWTSL